MAGNLSSLALATSFSSWAAPSSRLYSEWTWRWTNSACCTAGRLLELDRGGGLVGHVVEDGVDGYELGQRIRDLLHDGRRELGEVRRHAVARVHRPQHDRLAAGGAAERDHPHRELPDRVVKRVLAHDAGHGVVGLPQQRDALPRQATRPDRQPGDALSLAAMGHDGHPIDAPVLVGDPPRERA